MASPDDPPRPEAPARTARRDPRRGRGHALVGLGMVVAWALLITSYCLPTVTFQRLFKEPETFSIWQGVVGFWEDDSPILATIVFVFSMVFPGAKLIALGLLWWRTRPGSRRESAFVWLQFLGKWSMLDVLIIAMFVGAIRMGPEINGQIFSLAEGRSEIGIDLYGLAIVTSMLCTMGLERLEPVRHVPPPARRGWLDRVVALGFAGCFVATLFLPVFEVGTEAPVIGRIDREFSLGRTTWRMFDWNEWTMATALLVWAVGAPILRAIFGLIVRFRTAGARRMRWARGLDEWAMLDVFALGAAMVQVKLSQLADCELLAGFWTCLAAGVLGIVDSYLLRRGPRGEEAP